MDELCTSVGFVGLGCGQIGVGLWKIGGIVYNIRDGLYSCGTHFS